MYEVQGFGLNEEVLAEGLLDSIKKTIGDRVNQTVTIVNNTTTALQLIYRVVTDANYLDTAAFLLKKKIKQQTKQLATAGPILSQFVQQIMRVFPQGRTLVDFLKAIFLAAAVAGVSALVAKYNTITKAASEAAAAAKDQAVDLVKGLMSKFLSLDSMLARLTSASGIFTLLEQLGIANQLIFAALSDVASKIASAPMQNSA